jgi:hypothetical protein
MTRRVKVLIAVGGVAAVILAFVAWRVLTAESPVLSRASSPDGTWSVAVLGNWQPSGSHEIVVEVRDAQGRVAPNGAFVVGIAPDGAAAERDYAVTFESDEVARVGRSRTVEKSRYIR